jgi:hypothetical protein
MSRTLGIVPKTILRYRIGHRVTHLKALLTCVGVKIKMRHTLGLNLIRPSRRVLHHAERKITNVRKRRNRESEANSKESKRNYRQSNADQIQPGSYQEESSHNSKKSGQSQYYPQESKTDSSFAKEVVQFSIPYCNDVEIRYDSCFGSSPFCFCEFHAV